MTSASTPASRASARAPRTGRAGLPGRLRAEAELTARLTIDNAIAALIPGLLFTMAACVHYKVTGTELATRLALSCVIFALYLYVFDASNQYRAGAEDLLNKPHRPIPAGLTTPRGLLRRFWVAMALYTTLGVVTGTLPWVLLWQGTAIGLNLISTPRHYLYVKPLAMIAGILSQLAMAWTLAGPIDHTGWTWILTLTIVFNLPMRIEDVRDMDGDQRIGRTTLPLIIGHWPVRIWFVAVSLVLPLAIHILLFAPTRHPAPGTAICDALMIVTNWSAAALTLYPRTPRTDRIAYQLHCIAYCAVLACAIALLR